MVAQIQHNKMDVHHNMKVRSNKMVQCHTVHPSARPDLWIMIRHWNKNVTKHVLYILDISHSVEFLFSILWQIH
jgi:hypothetical protein